MKNKKLKFCFEQLTSPDITKLYIYDEVRAAGKFNWETWSYDESETSAKHIRDQLDAIPNDGTIELHVNSAGGEVGEGVTIYNLLKQKSKAGAKIIGYVDGMAYSVAMDIVMACDEIHMGLGSSMFLHYPWMNASGSAEELRGYADQLDALGNASLQLYLMRSNGKITEAELSDMMAKETMLEPDKCLQFGFCDVIDGLEDPGNDPETGLTQGTDPRQEKDDIKKQIKEQLVQQREITRLLESIRPKQEETNLSTTFANVVSILKK